MPIQRKTEATIKIAPNGFATSYPDSNTPDTYASQFLNMYINNLGNAEKRQGLSQFSVVPTNATITGIHELVQKDGTTTLFASGGGTIYKFDGTNWTSVFSFNSTSATVKALSMGGRLIFFNGIDRNIYTADGITFLELRSILEAGVAKTGSSAASLVDTTIANWTATNVAQYDVVYYTSLSAFGLITAVASAALTHTKVSSNALGIGAGRGEPDVDRPYQVLDTIACNIVSVTGQTDLVNVDKCATGTSASRIFAKKISNFLTTEIRVGDFVYNNDKAALTTVTAITTSYVGVVGITGQQVNEEVRFLKSSMPITNTGHVHYQRLYFVDARDEQKIRISSTNNSQGFGTTGAGTYDITSLQPAGEKIKAIHSFQKYFSISTTKNIYFYEGTNPIGSGADFNILGSFPVGSKGENSIASYGDDVIYITNNGINSTTLRKTAGQLVRKLASSQIDKTLVGLIKTAQDQDVFVFHYARRSWVCIKIGGEIYVYNYSVSDYPTETPGGQARSLSDNSESTKFAWHLFDGPFANQQIYYTRQNGDLLTGTVQGVINIFDQGVYADLGETIETRYQTNWTNVLPGKSSKIIKKHGKSIKPYVEAAAAIPINIMVEAPFSGESADEVTVTASTTLNVVGIGVIGVAKVGGNTVFNPKLPLRWNGEQARFSFNTNTTTGPITLGDFIVYANVFGVE